MYSSRLYCTCIMAYPRPQYDIFVRQQLGLCGMIFVLLKLITFIAVIYRPVTLGRCPVEVGIVVLPSIAEGHAEVNFNGRFAKERKSRSGCCHYVLD